MEDKKQDVNVLEELSKAADEFRKWAVDFGDKLSKVLDDIKALKKEEDTWEMEIPYEDGDEYYLLDDSGSDYKFKWDGYSVDKRRFEQGNVFPTKEEAELEAKRRNLLTRFRTFRDECNGDWKPCFGKQCKDSKYLIGYSWDSKDEQYKLKSLELGASNLFNQFGYFKNREDCGRAIELFGDEIEELFVDCEE